MRGKNRKVRAVTLKGKGLLSLKEYPYPELKENCAIIKMEYSGICGTDKHSFEGFFEQKGGRPIPLPVIQGHENVGIIENIFNWKLYENVFNQDCIMIQIIYFIICSLWRKQEPF